MRTTLTIDDDVLAAAKGLAARQNKTVGEVISALPHVASTSTYVAMEAVKDTGLA